MKFVFECRIYQSFSVSLEKVKKCKKEKTFLENTKFGVLGFLVVFVIVVLEVFVIVFIVVY